MRDRLRREVVGPQPVRSATNSATTWRQAVNRSVECANSVGTRKISSIRRRCSGTCAGATRLKSMSASLIASMSGTSGGQAFSRTRIRSSSASNAPHGTSFFDGKYRKNVRRPIPAAAAISSTVVCSNPRSANRANAVCSSSAREVTRFRPGWDMRQSYSWRP